MCAETLTDPRNDGDLWDNRGGPRGAGNTIEGLTHSSDLSREGLVMETTRAQQWRAIQETLTPTDAGCLEWNGPRYENGRAKHSPEYGRSTTAARRIYAIAVGDIPPGSQVTQTCRNLLCVNPEHLDLRAHGAGLSVKERLLRRVDKTPSCWLWTGSTVEGGYGQMNVDGHRIGVHRISYEIFVGPIPEGLQIDHLCFTRTCVNPEHLEAVTAYVNTARGNSPTSIHMRRLQGRASEHGSSRRYHGGCRCDACVEWSRIANRQTWGRRRQKDPVVACPECGRPTVTSKLERHQEGWRCIKEAANRARRNA